MESELSNLITQTKNMQLDEKKWNKLNEYNLNIFNTLVLLFFYYHYIHLSAEVTCNLGLWFYTEVDVSSWRPLIFLA